MFCQVEITTALSNATSKRIETHEDAIDISLHLDDLVRSLEVRTAYLLLTAASDLSKVYRLTSGSRRSSSLHDDALGGTF